MDKYNFTKPHTLAEQYSMLQTADSLLLEKGTSAWGVPEADVTTFDTDFKDYDTKYKTAGNPQLQSKANTASRNAAFDLSWEELSVIYTNYLLNNDAVSAADRETLSIYPVTTGSHEAYDAPSSAPGISFGTEDVSVLHAIYTESASSTRHRKPAGVAFCEIDYVVGKQPTSVEECTEHANVSHSNQAIVFDPTQQGQMVYSYARWVNKNGKCGPWSTMVSAPIP